MSRPLFDPARDPFADMRAAFEQANREHKNILVDVGGDWCIWCHRLEQFILDHPPLRALRDEHYITVKVYIGEDDTNVDFLQRLPPFESVPHLFVYNSQGYLLCSQPTDPFEVGESYSYEQVETFLKRWADPALTPWDGLSDDELRTRFVEQVVHQNTSGPNTAA
jgi:hypothetical protein